MNISLRALETAPNARVDFDYTIDLSEEEVHFEFPFPEPVRLCGCVRDVAGAVELEASVEATVHVSCARCGAPVVYEKTVPVRFLMSKTAPAEEHDDWIVIDGDEFDPAEVLVPELLLDMEMVVYCREDCRGRCPICGKDLNDGPCGCRPKEIDPRWIKLEVLLKNKDEIRSDD